MASNQSMSSVEVSLARISALRAKVQASTASVVAYGQSSLASLARYDHDTRSWKTFQHSLFGGLIAFSGTWPRSGMMRNGIAYLLPVLAYPKLGTESGLLPTMVHSDGKGAATQRFNGSTQYRGSKMSEKLRNSSSDPRYTHPHFAAIAMGFPKNWARTEMPLSRKSSKSSVARSSQRKTNEVKYGFFS